MSTSNSFSSRLSSMASSASSGLSSAASSASSGLSSARNYISPPTSDEQAIPSPDEVKALLNKKLKESIQTKTYIKDYFERSTTGEYLKKYEELKDYLPDDEEKIINTFVGKIQLLIDNDNDSKGVKIKKSGQMFKSIIEADYGLSPKQHPFKYDKYDDFVKDMNITKKIDTFLRSDTKPRALQQIVRLYKSEMRNKIYRRLKDKNGKSLFPYENEKDICFRLGEGRLDTIDNGFLTFFKELCDSLIKNKTKLSGIVTADKYLFGVAKNLTTDIPLTAVSLLKGILEGVNDSCEELVTARFSNKDEIIINNQHALKKLITYEETLMTSILKPTSSIAFRLSSKAFEDTLKNEKTYVSNILFDISTGKPFNEEMGKSFNKLLMVNRFIELVLYMFICSILTFTIYGMLEGIFHILTSTSNSFLKIFGINVIDIYSRILKNNKNKDNKFLEEINKINGVLEKKKGGGNFEGEVVSGGILNLHGTYDYFVFFSYVSILCLGAIMVASK